MEPCSLVIPAYNEETRIKEVIHRLLPALPSVTEYLIVCDGTDSTAEIVSDLRRADSRIIPLTSHARLGKGGGILLGMTHATGDRIGYADCDLSVSGPTLARMFSLLDQYPAVIGSRRAPGSRILTSQPFTRRLASKAFNEVIVRNLYGLPIADTQCGAKVFRADAIRPIIPRMRSRGFEFDVELLWRLTQAGHPVLEHGITWSHSDGSTFGFNHIPGMFVSLMNTRLDATARFECTMECD